MRKAGSRLRLSQQRNVVICRDFSGSDGTRTRDLRRDRPATTRRPWSTVSRRGTARHGKLICPLELCGSHRPTGGCRNQPALPSAHGEYATARFSARRSPALPRDSWVALRRLLRHLIRALPSARAGVRTDCRISRDFSGERSLTSVPEYAPKSHCPHDRIPFRRRSFAGSSYGPGRTRTCASRIKSPRSLTLVCGLNTGIAAFSE
jgi:hypothetical protein